MDIGDDEHRHEPGGVGLLQDEGRRGLVDEGNLHVKVRGNTIEVVFAAVELSMK